MYTSTRIMENTEKYCLFKYLNWKLARDNEYGMPTSWLMEFNQQLGLGNNNFNKMYVYTYTKPC